MLKVTSPIAKTYLGVSVYDAILENILSGALPSGAEVSEVSLAADFHVSRTPVHEAIQKLANDGLVVHESGRRPRVARFSRKEIAELYEMRKILEGAAVERAATRMDAETLRDLRKRADDLYSGHHKEAEWKRRALDFDQHFHDTLARASGCVRLHEDVQRYRLLVRAFCRITGTVQNLREALDEHLKVIKALQARNAEAARKAMAAHIDARLEVVLKEASPEVA
jgi:DNA-binding GntR family transcriptional regulator